MNPTNLIKIQILINLYSLHKLIKTIDRRSVCLGNLIRNQDLYKAELPTMQLLCKMDYVQYYIPINCTTDKDSVSVGNEYDRVVQFTKRLNYSFEESARNKLDLREISSDELHLYYLGRTDSE